MLDVDITDKNFPSYNVNSNIKLKVSHHSSETSNDEIQNMMYLRA